MSGGVRKSLSFDNIVAVNHNRRNRYSDISRLEHRKTIFVGDPYQNNNEDSDEDLNLSDDEDEDVDCFGRSDVDDIDSRNDHSFVKFAEAQDLQDVLRIFSQVKSELGLSENISSFQEIFVPLFRSLSPLLPHRYSELLRMIHNKSLSKDYKSNSVASGKHVLIIGKSQRDFFLKHDIFLQGVDLVD